MDFLKTLLAYMALLTTLGVQEGPAPQTVPTPTPLPAGVTATPLPNQTAAPTATPTPTIAPGAAMTPNKRYKKVDFGDKGTQVKNLQNRLIELGYMPKGSADGQYGYQTYNAVKEFQKANYLDVDGIAGPITLTYLYENPNIITLTGNTPVPTATPTPSLPPLATPTQAPASTADAVAAEQRTAAVTVAPAHTATAAPTSTPTAEPTAEPTVEPTAEPTVAATATPAPILTITPNYPDFIYPLENASIINRATGKALTYQAKQNGQTTLAKPALWVSDFGLATVSLSQMADCMGWSLLGSNINGLYTLRACGYVVTIDLQATGLQVLVDGAPTFLMDEDCVLHEGTLFVSEDFLRTVLNAETVFDSAENTLVLSLKNKGAAD